MILFIAFIPSGVWALNSNKTEIEIRISDVNHNNHLQFTKEDIAGSPVAIFRHLLSH